MGFVDFSFFIILDMFSVGFVIFILFISSMVFVYRNYYIGGGYYELRFCTILLLFIMSMSILVLRPGILGVLLG